MVDQSALDQALVDRRSPPVVSRSAPTDFDTGPRREVDDRTSLGGRYVAVLGGVWRKQPVEEDWRRKGATLSDKTARKEFGLTQAEIEAAIDAGQLQYRVGVVHGNPWLRLLRRELEALMESTYNDHDHRHRRAKAELVQVERDLRRLRPEVAALEEHRTKLLADVQE